MTYDTISDLRILFEECAANLACIDKTQIRQQTKISRLETEIVNYKEILFQLRQRYENK